MGPWSWGSAVFVHLRVDCIRNHSRGVHPTSHAPHSLQMRARGLNRDNVYYGKNVPMSCSSCVLVHDPLVHAPERRFFAAFSLYQTWNADVRSHLNHFRFRFISSFFSILGDQAATLVQLYSHFAVSDRSPPTCGPQSLSFIFHPVGQSMTHWHTMVGT